jgi:F-type H+-transporting ATPase subunit b
MRMNTLLMLAATAPTDGGQGPIAEIAGQFGVTWPLLISQVILFVLVALALKTWAYGPLLRMLEQRRERIAESLANADKIKAELAATEASRQEVLNRAGVEANKLIEEARAAANALREQETQKAIAAAEQIVAKAREATQQDHARMLADLRKEIGRLVVQTTVTVTGKVLTAEDQKRLAEETTRQLSA